MRVILRLRQIRPFDALGRWHCRHFHDAPMAWIHDHYECGKCGRIIWFPVVAPPRVSISSKPVVLPAAADSLERI